MKKIIYGLLVVVIFIMLAVMVAGIYRFNFTDGGDIIPGTNAPDAWNASYIIEKEKIALKNGAASSTQGGTLRIFGEPMYGDYNADTKNDAAVLLVHQGVGSGTFYYAALVISKDGGYTVTNTLFLGDRISPQNISLDNGRVVYNYAVRNNNEPMTTPPSLGKSLYIHYDTSTGEIGELVKDFEGEADPSRMSLDMKSWVWTKTQMNDGATKTPKKSDAFTLNFTNDGGVSITTDCNRMSGTYKVDGNTLTFSSLMSTKMYCEGSQEQDFAKALAQVATFFFTSKGELVLELKMDSGSMTFK